jgi:hypothetical protein
MDGMGLCTKQFRGIRGGAIYLGKTAAPESRKVFFMKSLQSPQSRHATRVEAAGWNSKPGIQTGHFRICRHAAALIVSLLARRLIVA